MVDERRERIEPRIGGLLYDVNVSSIPLVRLVPRKVDDGVFREISRRFKERYVGSRDVLLLKLRRRLDRYLPEPCHAKERD